MDYLPIQELSNRWNISKRRIQILCKEGRIEGAKMIGNMWVVPSDAKRPRDARVKNPTVTKNKDTSIVRRELKKILKKLFKIAGECGIKEEDKRNIVLSSIAYSLCTVYLNEEKNADKIFMTIYKDISGKCEEIQPDLKMLEIACEFVDKYLGDPEINNILSWAYQYSNKIVKKNIYSKTQFFTEKYMIDYLVKNVGGVEKAKKIVDPCTGGGNFLVECLEYMCNSQSGGDFRKGVISNAKRLYGYDIDNDIARIAIVNIRLRAMAILNNKCVSFKFNIWNRICPNIYVSKQDDSICGSLATDNRLVFNLVNGTELVINEALGEADIILTNPPFATIKGMLQQEKDFLKAYYPDANCDTCVSFLDAIYGMLKKGGICGIVSQNAWMHLKTFRNIRNKFISQYTIHKIANLGSGAFFDLSGEKSNVSLIVVEKKCEANNEVEVLNLTTLPLKEKIEKLKRGEDYLKIEQSVLDGPNGFDFTKRGTLNAISSSEELYKDVAVPMQGTSTGNAKELVGYFWEHFGEEDWVSVSNGGGYCRWQGLNDSVVKWGKDGEYIKAQKGSALRNVKYFSKTQMVFSDTGTAGLNVRVLLNNQIFIASGPGIRVTKGNEYAHLALLNSRLAAYFVRIMSPKLTIAAGYIGQIPVNEKIYSSVVLEKDAKLCVELKKKILSTRPNNLEYDSTFIENVLGDLDNATWRLFNEDITNELLKLEIESKIDQYIFKEYGFSDEEERQLSQSVGPCAYLIDDVREVDIKKLDKYISKLIDASCCLKRTRPSKNSLGSDGILEFVAKDLGINPEVVVRKIQENPFTMQSVLKKYKEMILHDAILYRLGYNTKNGIQISMCSLTELTSYLEKKFESPIKYDKWIKESFNQIHKEIFKGVPYLIYENEEIHKYDNKVA
ncbi:MAG: N-6 DNA methylase [Lachnospiraceae bacterium]|nr:N-6 DNA methylase [Lachnospiraceae bacterium]